MARRRYYRSRRTIPRQKWLTNMCNVLINSNSAQNTVINAGYCYLFKAEVIVNTGNLTQVSAQQTSTTTNTSILKTGRWKCKGVITAGSEALNYMVGLMYIPEGYDTTISSTTVISQTVVFRHPEWVLCWKRFDYTNAGQSNEFSISSRLKRNLNSNDKIVMFLIMDNASAGNVTINSGVSLARSTVTYVCRTN